MNIVEFVAENKIEAVSQIQSYIQEVGRKFNIDELFLDPLNLALEEAFANCVMYAYPEGVTGQIKIQASCIEASSNSEENLMPVTQISFKLIDNGKPFDPTQIPDADITLSPEERNVGGLGIFLIKQLMDSVQYERKDNCNILTLQKNIISI
ncbi:MAG: ATP-binding protein [Bacteroidaceae bacterium]|nr:ATP-binding protein [Bacteroidaceae bacterium]